MCQNFMTGYLSWRQPSMMMGTRIFIEKRNLGYSGPRLKNDSLALDIKTIPFQLTGVSRDLLSRVDI